MIALKTGFQLVTISQNNFRTPDNGLNFNQTVNTVANYSLKLEPLTIKIEFYRTIHWKNRYLGTKGGALLFSHPPTQTW